MCQTQGKFDFLFGKTMMQVRKEKERKKHEKLGVHERNMKVQLENKCEVPSFDERAEASSGHCG